MSTPSDYVLNHFSVFQPTIKLCQIYLVEFEFFRFVKTLIFNFIPHK